ncbi:DUF6919 domain-containing protein [Streptomyces omiyaensis]|uniref:DUF6919 domain-containing protein n=1 Tax=Streptomyces omiyaensis TaxID=68247 RepID=UPI0036FBED1F
MVKLPWMSSADMRRWRTATTLTDLGSLTASWLLGDIASQAGYTPNCGPDEETGPLVPILVAVNRLGFLTDDSQPGCDATGTGGEKWLQRAAVTGLIDDTVLAGRLTAAAEEAGLLVLNRGLAFDGNLDGIVVTQVDGKDYTTYGRPMTPEALRVTWPERIIGRTAFTRVTQAWQLTLVDPEWGPSGRLWEVLASVVRRYRLDAVEQKARTARAALCPEYLRRHYAFPDLARTAVAQLHGTALDDAIAAAKLSGCTDDEIELVTQAS